MEHHGSEEYRIFVNAISKGKYEMRAQEGGGGFSKAVRKT